LASVDRSAGVGVWLGGLTEPPFRGDLTEKKGGPWEEKRQDRKKSKEGNEKGREVRERRYTVCVGQ